MKVTVSLILFAVLLLIALLHIYWGFGGKLGLNYAVPTKDKPGEEQQKVFTPKPIECFIVGCLLFVIAALIIANAHFFELVLPTWLSSYGLWFLASIFILRAIGDFNYVGFFKKVKSTPFGVIDTKIYSPLCLILGFAIIFISQ